MDGLQPAAATETMRARGFRPSALALSALMTSTHDAPSEMAELLPAVTEPLGLKAGRNTEPFLLQVYRRDMGGGAFKLMKDVSAPIRAGGAHWGGLRLAYMA